MRAVILAAGKSTRTYPLTLTRPKCLLKIGNKTILEHNLEQLAGLVNEAVIVIGYKYGEIKKLGRKFRDIKLTYIEQKEQLGTGHALLQAEKLIKGRFIVLMGDDLYGRDSIKRCLKHKYCLLADKSNNPSKFAVLKVKGNRIMDILEKPAKASSDLVNCGLYVLDQKIFAHLKKLRKSPRGEYEITDAIKSLAREARINYELARGTWHPVAYSWDMLNVNEHGLKRIKRSIRGKIERNATIKGSVIIGKNTLVKNGAYIEGPAIIGDNCIIGPNCYIRNSCIGENCRIGNSVEVKSCILMENVNVGHLSYLGDSIIGSSVNIGAGTITANLRHDGDTVKSIINTLIYPGRKIWPDKATLPGEIVKKDLM